MNLIEALEYKKRRFPEDASVLKVFLGCGFTPVHLETFLAAHIGAILSKTRVEIKTGLFGDLLGNVERVEPANFDAIAVVVEWADLDQRLGVRNLGGWQVDRLPDVLETVSRSLARLGQTLQRLSSSRSSPFVCQLFLSRRYSSLPIKRAATMSFNCGSIWRRLQCLLPDFLAFES